MKEINYNFHNCLITHLYDMGTLLICFYSEPFHFQELSKGNYTLHYKYTNNQTGDESKETYQLGNVGANIKKAWKIVSYA